MRETTAEEKLSTLRVLLLGVAVAIVGVGCLYLSSLPGVWEGKEVWRVVLQQVGGVLFVTVAIGLLWELRGKRAFLEEVLAKTQVAHDLQNAGITRITDIFHYDVPWKSYFETVTKLDIFFAYGRTWRNAHMPQLRALAGKVGGRIRLVLPDPEDPHTMEELGRRFDRAPEQIRTEVQEALADFAGLRSPDGALNADIEVWFLAATPQFSLYRFDRTAVMALYTHRKERVPIPTFVCEMGGTLYDFIRKEFKGVTAAGGPARKVNVEEMASDSRTSSE